MGSPLGLAGTVTAGIVSAVHRSVEVAIGGGQSAQPVGAVQTDAAINPGNSGGVLADCQAHLIGIPTASATRPGQDGEAAGNIGIGFAVPADLAAPIARRLLVGLPVRHSYTGLDTTPVTTANPNPAASTGTPTGAAGNPAARPNAPSSNPVTSSPGCPARPTRRSPHWMRSP